MRASNRIAPANAESSSRGDPCDIGPAWLRSLVVNTPRNSVVLAVVSALLVAVLPGCVLPYSEAGTTTYARTSEDHRTNECILVVYRHHGWMNLLTPEGPQYLSTSAGKRHYYFSDHRVRRRSLGFLKGNADVDWEVLAPVEDTTSWVRVEARGKFFTASGTNVVITLFTPRELLHQQSIQMKGIAYRELLDFTNGNRTVCYKSESDVFTYNAVADSLTKNNAK